MARAASHPAPAAVDTLDDVFPDPDGVIAALVAAMPAPSPSQALRVSALFAGAR